MTVVIVYALWTVFGSIFACFPVRAFWTREPGAKCIDQFSMWLYVPLAPYPDYNTWLIYHLAPMQQ